LVYDSLLPAGEVNQPESLQRDAHGAQSVVRPMLVADQLLHFRANSSPSFDATYHSGEHLNAALLGSGTSVLGAMVLWLLMVGRVRAINLAEGMTRDLERLAMVAKRTSNAVYFADTEWRIHWINEGFTRMCGFSATEAVGLRPSELLHSPLADPATASTIDSKVALDQRVNIQVLQRSKGGRDFWVDLEVITIFGNDGRITGYMSVQSDITEEVQAKAALVLEKERAENILSGTNVGTWESNLLTGEQRWNDRWSAMIGFTRAEVSPSMAEFMRQRLHLADRARLHRALVECVTGRSDSMSCEVRVLRRDGSWMWILSRAKVMSRRPDGRAEWIGGIHTDITEIKQVELSLRDMEAFLDRAGRIAGVGAWQMDLHTRELVFSPQTREIHGLEPDAVLSEEVALAFYPEPDRQRVRDALHNAERGGTSWDMVVQLQKPAGELRWVRIFCEVWFDDNGPVRLMGAFQDVTKDRLAQIEAERTSAKRGEEQRRLQSILDGTQVGTWEWNVQTGESFYNEQYVGMLGYTQQELEPMGYGTWVRLAHPDDLAAAAQKMQKHLSGELAHYEIEARMQHKEGHWIWVLARGRLAQRTADGSPLWVYGTHMDITERKRATEELAQTSAMLQNVLDSATAVGVITLGLDQILRVFNRGAENLLGYSAQELVGRRSAEVFFDRPELDAMGETLALVRGHEPTPHDVFAQVLQTREEQEWTLMRKNATRFKARLIFSPMHDAEGTLQGHLAMVYDISKQKEYESTLRDAMRLAEQSSVAKSQFLANMSHEIRTPMNAILGMLQLLRNTPLKPQQHDYTDKAVGAARSLLGLLNDILDFSKVEAGKMQLNAEAFAVNGLLGDLSVILSSNLGSKPVDLVFDVDPLIPPTLIGDTMRLKQILINLGGNAVKFTEQGEVAIRLSLLAHTPERVKLAVAVVDSGIGIAPENQSRIFDAFTQAEANTTRRFGGTGLGLVISTRLIRLMGGELQLSSVLGQGSVFSFTLELPTTDFTVDAAPASAALAAPGVRVLLVDDNPHALASASAMLRALGWEVLQAASGAQALECLEGERASHAAPLDAVFVDAEMPGMDGWTTLRQVHRLYPDGAAPLLILLSRQSAEALAQRTDREHDLLDGLLVRPVTGPLFAKALQQARSGNEALTQRQASPKRLQGMRILLVEDNPINQQVAQELLEGMGAWVTLANNGALGLEAIHAARPAYHVVLMDLQMPVMDGLSATRLLRKDARYADLPVIAMTANAMHSDREECLAAGMNDHVGKPFDLNELVQTLIHHTHWVERVAPSAAHDANPAVTQAPSAGVLSAWPTGLDIEQALSRMGGERALLQRAVAAFVTDARLLPQRLEQALQQGVLDQVKRELHSAKGLAATVGATELSGLAAKAEQQVALAQGRDECLQAVAQFCRQLMAQLPALEAVALRLQGAQALPASARRAQPASEGERAQWQRLLAALQVSDMVALELHAELRQHMDALTDPQIDSTLEALDQAMAELDFDVAAAVCEKLVRQWDTEEARTLT
jgi:PAS domain S-box-containing protein